MKKLILIIIVAVTSLPMFSQDCDIPLRPLVVHAETAQIDNYLTNKLRMLVSNSSSASSLDNDQFAIAIDYDIVDKQIVGGTPTKIIYALNVTLNIVDMKESKIYATYTKELQGIGDNESKALFNAFHKFNISNVDIKTFVLQGKKKILDYYNNNYQTLIRSAKVKSAMKNFDAAIYTLLMIPECCDGYETVSQELMIIYQQFVNQHCNENLAQARAAWVASPNAEGAATASIYLSEIYPDAACYRDALSLADEIKKRMNEEWKFEMRQWSDEISLERQRINAMREIGVAYANSQPKTQETNIFWK